MSPAGSDDTEAPGAVPERTARYDVHLDAERRVRWRLVAPNGRVIARSARGHASAAACRAELDALRSRVALLRPLTGRADGGRGWCWSLAIDGGPVVAVSARTYERLESCQISFDRFVRALVAVAPGEDW
ncbi:YegP family protein [Yinghuangia soli]|uniref:DUF1508 domain-containing protein n=1 Tax=Yinghuangia soli TaxID=2908204 RepID=A0AA41Q2N6_9ACTN|nr:DUF1508 domain-containing protein [Yinghuangia soli]MCF2528987.1 DUF1508 domain-containing protein [Yinghuangia soli]